MQTNARKCTQGSRSHKGRYQWRQGGTNKDTGEEKERARRVEALRISHGDRFSKTGAQSSQNTEEGSQLFKVLRKRVVEMKKAQKTGFSTSKYVKSGL